MNQIKRNNNNRSRGSYGRKPNKSGGQSGQRQNPARMKQHATQMMEKYLLLYKERRNSGDRVEAETFRQYADHYFRVIAEANVMLQEQQENQDRSQHSSSAESSVVEPLDPDQAVD